MGQETRFFEKTGFLRRTGKMPVLRENKLPFFTIIAMTATHIFRLLNKAKCC